MTQHLIVKDEITIHAPIRKVWAILTEPEWVKRYMYNYEVISSWRVGGPILFRDESGVKIQGNILAIEPNKTLQFTTFDPNLPRPKEKKQLVVTYSLEPENQGTHFTITQGDFAGLENAENRYNENVKAWHYVLDTIKNLAEKFFPASK